MSVGVVGVGKDLQRERRREGAQVFLIGMQEMQVCSRELENSVRISMVSSGGIYPISIPFGINPQEGQQTSKDGGDASSPELRRKLRVIRRSSGG